MEAAGIRAVRFGPGSASFGSNSVTDSGADFGALVQSMVLAAGPAFTGQAPVTEAKAVFPDAGAGGEKTAPGSKAPEAQFPAVDTAIPKAPDSRRTVEAPAREVTDAGKSDAIPRRAQAGEEAQGIPDGGGSSTANVAGSASGSTTRAADGVRSGGATGKSTAANVQRKKPDEETTDGPIGKFRGTDSARGASPAAVRPAQPPAPAFSASAPAPAAAPALATEKSRINGGKAGAASAGARSTVAGATVAPETALARARTASLDGEQPASAGEPATGAQSRTAAAKQTAEAAASNPVPLRSGEPAAHREGATAVQPQATAVPSAIPPAAAGAAMPNLTAAGAAGAVPHAAAQPVAAHAGTAFDRIDAAPLTAPQILTSAPQRLDVGVNDPSLGWVEVRAHAAGGQIAATLNTATPAAHAALTAQLPAMRESLAGQPVRVDTMFSQTASSGGGQGNPPQQGREGQGAAMSAGSPAIAGGEGETASVPDSLSWIDIRV